MTSVKPQEGTGGDHLFLPEGDPSVLRRLTETGP